MVIISWLNWIWIHFQNLMLCQAQSGYFASCIHYFLDNHKSSTIQMSQTISLFIFNVLGCPTYVPFVIIVSKFNFKKWLCIKIFNIIFFAFEGP